MKKEKKLFNPFRRIVRTMSRDKIRIKELKLERGMYKGEVSVKNKPHGNGRLVFHNQEKYVGYFKDGKMEGKGDYFYKDNKLKYSGDWKADLKDGKGEYHFLEGGKYVGEWKRGMKDGFGCTHHKNGQKKYEGEWKGNYIWGNGKYYRSSGKLMYDGCFYKGKRKGVGKNYYSNTEIYEGDWKDDMKHGDGKYYFKNKDVYDGEWFKDKRAGIGKLVTSDGKIYEGEFKDDKKCGKGKMFQLMEDGTKLLQREGVWVDGVFAGNAKKKETETSSNRPKTFTPQTITRFDSQAKKGEYFEEKYEDLKDKVNCVICVETKKDMLFLPCKHLCTCEDCASKIEKCPLCRKVIQAKIHAYI